MQLTILIAVLVQSTDSNNQPTWEEVCMRWKLRHIWRWVHFFPLNLHDFCDIAHWSLAYNTWIAMMLLRSPHMNMCLLCTTVMYYLLLWQCSDVWRSGGASRSLLVASAASVPPLSSLSRSSGTSMMRRIWRHLTNLHLLMINRHSLLSSDEMCIENHDPRRTQVYFQVIPALVVKVSWWLTSWNCKLRQRTLYWLSTNIFDFRLCLGYAYIIFVCSSPKCVQPTARMTVKKRCAIMP